MYEMLRKTAKEGCSICLCYKSKNPLKGLKKNDLGLKDLMF